MPAALDDQAHVLPRRDTVVVNLIHVGVSDHRMAATFPVYGFECLRRDPALIGFALVDCLECTVGEREHGTPHGIAGFSSDRRQRAFPFPVGQRKDQLRLREVSDELKFGIRSNGPQALGGNERRIRKVQGAQGATSSCDLFGRNIVVNPTGFLFVGTNGTPECVDRVYETQNSAFGSGRRTRPGPGGLR